jgi:hypothetical protein
MEEFTQHHWNHMHDCILHATWNTTKKKSTKEELVEIFNKLPEDLKEDAYEWGMSELYGEINLLNGMMKIVYNVRA